MALDVAIARSPSSIVAGTTILATGQSLGESFPTMASINANYTHFNQAVALYNRRANQTMITPDIMSYFLSGNISASGLTLLRTKINTLRTALGLSTFTWNNPTRSTGDAIKKVDLDNLFSALNFTTLYNSAVYVFAIKTENRSPRGTRTAINENDTPSVFNIARLASSNVSTPEQVVLNRYGFSFSSANYSALIKNPTNAVVSLPTLASWLNTLSTWAPVLYSSNTDDSLLPTGWWQNTNNLISTFAYNVSSASIAVPGSIVSARFGSRISFILGVKPEIDGYSGGTYPSAPAGTAKENSFSCSSGVRFLFDYGF